MLERSITPNFGKIENINLMEPKLAHLDNGIPVFSIDAGVQEVLKIELVFPAGTVTADKKLVAAASIGLLTEGTSNRTSAEIAESVDFYGAYLQTHVTHDESSLELYTLNKHLKSTLETLAEVYADPIFPENELLTYQMSGKQEMMVSEEKVGHLGAKAFSAALFGAETPYGRSADVADYDNLSRAELVAFHQQHISKNIKHIIVAGKLTADTITELNRHFGQEKRKTEDTASIAATSAEQKTTHIVKEEAVQNSIRIGRVLFNRTHTDFVGMQILVTILGGYFGSRLMKNIREDKGYTYGIGAGMVSMRNAGYLSISTEVGADVCVAALNEIHLEIERLRKEPVPLNELELVRNYMMGSILKSVDGPFAIAIKWKTYLKYGLGKETHEELLHQIKTITPERLIKLANKYLQPEDLVQISAGAPLKVS